MPGAEGAAASVEIANGGRDSIEKMTEQTGAGAPKLVADHSTVEASSGKPATETGPAFEVGGPSAIETVAELDGQEAHLVQESQESQDSAVEFVRANVRVQTVFDDDDG